MGECLPGMHKVLGSDPSTAKHTRAHTYMHAHTHTQAHAHSHTRRHTHTHTQAHTVKERMRGCFPIILA